MAEYGPDEFYQDWFYEHDKDGDDTRMHDLWDELNLYEIMHESTSQEDFHERLAEAMEDLEFERLMNELLDLLDYDDINDFEGWYHD